MAVEAFIQLLNIHIFCHVSARYRNLLQLVSPDLDQFVKIKENRAQLKTGLIYRIASTTNGQKETLCGAKSDVVHFFSPDFKARATYGGLRAQ